MPINAFDMVADSAVYSARSARELGESVRWAI
jgi:hypothetical protein